MKVVLTIVLMSLVGIAYAENEIDAKVEAALADESRPAEDRMRDRNRRPLDTLNFFGLKDNMRVLELIPGGGWYTRVLAPVLADNGKLYVALGTGRVRQCPQLAGIRTGRRIGHIGQSSPARRQSLLRCG